MDILNLPFLSDTGKEDFARAITFAHIIDVEHQTELLSSFFKTPAPVAIISTSQLLLANEPASPWADFVRANAEVFKANNVHISEHRDNVSVVLAIYWQLESNN